MYIIYIYVHVYIYIMCIYICIYVYIHIYIHREREIISHRTTRQCSALLMMHCPYALYASANFITCACMQRYTHVHTKSSTHSRRIASKRTAREFCDDIAGRCLDRSHHRHDTIKMSMCMKRCCAIGALPLIVPMNASSLNVWEYLGLCPRSKMMLMRWHTVPWINLEST